MYLDASILVTLLGDEPAAEAAYRIVEEAEAPLLVSDLASGEVASALARLVRMQQVAEATALARLAAFDDWRAAASSPIEVLPQDVRLAERLVRQFELGLRMPDAIHLAICQSREFVIATFDRRLASAARTLGMVVVP